MTRRTAAQKRKMADPNSKRQQRKQQRREGDWWDEDQLSHWNNIERHFFEFHSLQSLLDENEMQALLAGIEANEDAAAADASDEQVDLIDSAVAARTIPDVEEGEISEEAETAPNATTADVDLVQKVITSWHWAGYFQGLYEGQMGQRWATETVDPLEETQPEASHGDDIVSTAIEDQG